MRLIVMGSHTFLQELVPVAPDPIDLTVPGAGRLVEAFLTGRTEATRKAYAGDLMAFGRFCGRGPVEAIDGLIQLDGGPANELVMRWRNAMVDRGLSPATIARRLAAVRSIVRDGRTLGYCTFSIEIRDPEVQKYRDTRGPGLEGWRAMRTTAEALAERKPEGTSHPHQAARDLALVRLIRGLALRRSSAVRIDLADLELSAEKSTVWVYVKGKRDKVLRTIPPGVVGDLRRWLDLRGEEPGPLFIRLDRAAGEWSRISGTTVYNVVRRLGRRAGLKRDVRPHGLRHEAITAAARKGYRMDEVQEFAGHSDPRTTSLYIERERDAAGKVAGGIDED